MFKSGFQPVCVLYQGNQSPFDGSCQLVCRHQIQQTNFSQGDIVKVVDLIETGVSSNGTEEPGSRQAIVMGQEMVSSLIGTLFPTKQSDEPNCSKKRKTSDDTEVKLEDKSRQEEIGVLQDVVSTMKGLKEEVLKQGLELSHMKQKQVQMMNLLRVVLRKQQDILKHQETEGNSVQSPGQAETRRSPLVTIKMQEEDVDEVGDVGDASGPIITSVRSASTGAAGHVLEEGYMMRVPEEVHSPASDPASATFAEDMVYSVMDMSPGHDQGWEQEQDPGSPPANIDNRKAYLENYKVTWRHGDNVEIGNFTFKVCPCRSGSRIDLLYSLHVVRGD